MEKKRVLVVGGSGYLGQHLLQVFSRIEGNPYDLAFTHHSIPPQPLLDAISPSLSFHVDLQTGQGLTTISETFGQPDVIVNCAALSVPRACEMDPTTAMATNVPSSLVKWLSIFAKTTLLIHLSTDQVYEGLKSFYKEDDVTVPVNVYGKSKLAAEQFISANCSSFAILRSSIIYGPQTISPVMKSLPIQWIDSVLSRGDKVEFFHDEFRCPVYVNDVVKVILALTKMWSTGLQNSDLMRQRIGKIGDFVPFFGKGFNNINPLIMVIYTLLVASNFFDPLQTGIAPHRLPYGLPKEIAELVSVFCI